MRIIIKSEPNSRSSYTDQEVYDVTVEEVAIHTREGDPSNFLLLLTYCTLEINPLSTASLLLCR